MSDGITPGGILVVSLRLRVLEPSGLYRVEATVQAVFNGGIVYQQEVAHEATWANVVTWLGALLSSTDATTTVESHLSYLRSI